MYTEHLSLQKDSPAWVFFVKLSFALALVSTSVGIFFLPLDWWIKGYLGMGLYFCVSASISLSKTLRDEHESKKLIKKVSSAEAERVLLNEIERKSVPTRK